MATCRAFCGCEGQCGVGLKLRWGNRKFLWGCAGIICFVKWFLCGNCGGKRTFVWWKSGAKWQTLRYLSIVRKKYVKITVHVICKNLIYFLKKLSKNHKFNVGEIFEGCFGGKSVVFI